MLKRPHLTDHLWVRMVNPDNMKPISEEIEIDSDNLAIDEWSWTIPAVNGSQQSMIQITLNQ